MVKTLNIPFEQDEFERLLEKKPPKMSWHDYIIMLVEEKQNE